jgi:DNA-binding response OmpR family regulator
VSAILIVDDETAIGRMCGNYLQSLGYNVAVASTVEEALKFRERFDLALLDVVMPGMDGSKLATELRKLTPDLKVIFMSGFKGNVSLPEDAVLVDKPFKWTELEGKIKEMLDKPPVQEYFGD